MYKTFLILTCCAVFSFFSSVASADVFKGTVVKVTDGDTIQVLSDNQTIKVRLEGIDCPERKQPFGYRAKQFVLELAAGKTVTVYQSTVDRYGRAIGEVVLSTGENLGQELVRNGLAWHYKRYSSDKVLSALEIEARAAKRGLWGDSNAIAPWEWRRGKR